MYNSQDNFHKLIHFNTRLKNIINNMNLYQMRLYNHYYMMNKYWHLNMLHNLFHMNYTHYLINIIQLDKYIIQKTMWQFRYSYYIQLIKLMDLPYKRHIRLLQNMTSKYH